MVGSKFTKVITNYGLVVDGKFVKFRTKSNAIKTGKKLYKIDNTVKLVEKYTMWALKSEGSEIIDKKEFDRTILIKDVL